MTKRITLLALIFILSIASPVLATEPGSGVIEGRIINGTAGGSIIADQEITLNTYLDEAQETATSLTYGEGQFKFEGLPTAPDYTYEVEISFQGAEYYSERLTFNEGETAKSTGLTVYDSTTSDETIKITMSHMILYPEGATLLVKEYYLLENEADRTYIGATGEINAGVLYFSLPEGAIELQPTMGLMDCCIINNESGFADTMPFLPGMKEIAYSYRLSPSPGTYTFSRIVNYPLNKLDLLVQGEDIEMTSEQLTADEPLNISDIYYEHLSGQEFSPGDILTIRLSELSGTDNQDSTTIWMFLALAVIAAGIIFVFMIRKKKPIPVGNEDDFSLRKQQLLAELAGLDNDLENGRIHEKDHDRLRVEKKAQLMALMRKQKEE